jgi:WhiB family transcriptional regulator, redox-sensing transcriptional regulator
MCKLIVMLDVRAGRLGCVMTNERRWTEQAACKGADQRIFYQSGANPLYTQAKSICAKCPVRLECLQDAMEWEKTNLRIGMWGGMTPRERQMLAKKLDGEDVGYLVLGLLKRVEEKTKTRDRIGGVDEVTLAWQEKKARDEGM